jgi:hypothetical protein
MPSGLHRLIQTRPGESATAWLMFAYSFLAMTSHNIVKPITKSKFIVDLGAVGAAARYGPTYAVDELSKPFGVVQEQAAVQPGGQVELPLALRNLVQDATRQDQPALVVQSVLRAAKVGNHRVGTGAAAPCRAEPYLAPNHSQPF